jgi:hypothetical protein
MPGATLTLGLNNFILNPPSNSGVTVANVGSANFDVSTDSTSVTPLVVKTSTDPTESATAHTVTFKTALGAVDVDTTLQASGTTDRGDRITFQQTVGDAKVKAGDSGAPPQVVSGDTVTFQGGLGSGSTIVTGSGRDSVLFASSAANAYSGTAGTNLVSTGAGSDSIRFSSTTQVGPDITLDFGTPGATDLDILFGAAKSTFQSAGLQIVNFSQGFDQVRVGDTTLKTQTEINTFFGDSGQSIKLV